MDYYSNKAAEPAGPFPHAKRVGDWLFLSGIGPRIRGSKEIPGVTLDENGEVQEHDIELQFRSVFENIRILLQEAGASLEHLVDVTVYLTHMKKDFKLYNQLWKEVFPHSSPCRTTLEVLSLPTPIAIELKCVAWLGAEAKNV